MREHLTRELFRAIHQGWRNPGDLAAVAMAHLFELCPACRGEFEGWRRELEGDAPPVEPGDFDTAIDRIRSSQAELDRDAVPKEDRRQEARSRAQELLALQPEERADWIRSEAAKRSGLLLAEALIEECRRRTPGYPHDGCILANLARLVLHHSPVSLEATECYGRALAWLANAVRVVGDLPRAEQIFGDARYFFRSHEVGDRQLRAELDRLEGALRNNQGRPREAMTLLLRAQIASRMEGSEPDAIASLLLLVRVHDQLGELERCKELLAEADECLMGRPDPERAGPRLLVCATERRAVLLAKSERAPEAIGLIEHLEELRASLKDPVIRIRSKWLRAQIYKSLRELQQAEEAYLDAARGFSTRRMLDDVARIQLELARLYIEQGRLGEARTLTDEAEPVFVDNHLPAKVAESQRLRALAACRST